ncbi:MAG: hypothetical protein HOO96_02300 [Polyangiaceae bacterium]|nr:hypothetical protein [Polyangiaceae bacterium]
MTRRAWLAAAAALGAVRSVRAAEGPLVVRDVALRGRRALLVSPLPSVPASIPLVVLLHGLGETGDPRAGAYAYWERYGLPGAYARLLAPPVTRISRAGYFTDAALTRVNAALAERPFGPLAFLCPHVPNLQSPVQVAPFAMWLVKEGIPEARALFASAGTRLGKVLLAGCSLGAFIGFESLLAFPGEFAAVAGVQSAIGAGAAPRYARAFADAGVRTYLSTSSGDPYRGPTRALATALRGRGLAPDTHEAPGPHDQPWLREVGMVELLLWLHRAAS